MYAQKYRIFRLFGNLKAFFNVAAFGVPDAVVIQVADEIVVDEVDMATIAGIVQRLQLGQHLRHGLGPRLPGRPRATPERPVGRGAPPRSGSR